MHFFNYRLYTKLPGMTKDGHMVIYTRLIDLDPSSYDDEIVIKLVIMISEIYQIEKGTCSGILVVLDMEGAVLAHASKVHFSTMKNIARFLEVRNSLFAVIMFESFS
jgi:CRAL/TRIO domain